MSTKTATRQPPVKERKLDREHGQRLLRQMVRIRRLEEKSAQMYSAMKIPDFMHTSPATRSSPPIATMPMRFSSERLHAR